MANAFSGRITEDDISFDSTSYISNNDSWQTKSGSISYGSTISMGANSRCALTKSITKMKCNYLKLKIRLSSDDTSLTTDNFHAVTGMYEITVEDKDGNTKKLNYHFYPKYIFEDDFQNDYTVIQLGNNVYFKGVKVELINKETVQVKILETGLYVSRVIDKETVDNEIEDTVLDNQEIYDYINDLIDSRIDTNMPEYYDDMVEKMGTYIEPRTDDPPAASLYAGRIWLREDLVT